MNSEENRQIVDLIKFLHKGIQKHGITKIVKTLKSVDLYYINGKNHDLLNFIVDETCTILNVPRTELYENKKRGNVTIARDICILLLRKHLKLSDIEAGSHFNRSRQVVHFAESKFKSLSINTKTEREFIQTYNYLNQKVLDYLSNIKAEEND